MKEVNLKEITNVISSFLIDESEKAGHTVTGEPMVKVVDSLSINIQASILERPLVPDYIRLQQFLETVKEYRTD